MIEQNLDGHHNVVVAVDGNANTVTISLGSATLTLDLAHRRRGREIKSSRDLLLTEFRATTLVGRDKELNEFVAWLASSTPIAVHCVIGRGGAGKTRFGIELCERAETMGWTAGFVTDRELARFQEKQNLSGWLWKGPTLLVIDYASAKAAILREWLDELARRPDPDATAHPLRILLLERHADRDLGWWSELGRQGGLSGRRGDGFLDGVEPFALPSLTELEDRRRLMAQAMELAAPLKPGTKAPSLPDLGTDPSFDQALLADRIDNEPLYLMMAAIVALDEGAPAALNQSRTGLAETIANHEAARLEKIAAGHCLDPVLFTHLAACVTLQGGCSREDAERLIEQERTTNSAWSSVSPEDAAEWLADGLPGQDGGLDAVRPDLIGGAFLLAVLRRKKRSLEKQKAIVERAWDRAGVAVAQTIIRTAVDHAGRHPKHESLEWLHHLIELADSPEALAAMTDAIPEHTVALRECACAAQERLVSSLRINTDGDPEKTAILAANLNNLASFLTAAGRRKAALEAATEAVDHYRYLANLQPEVFTHVLAGSLNNLANSFADLELREAALEAANEAVDHHRRLVSQWPDIFTPGLAMSLYNLANRLSAMGRREAALDVAIESVTLRRQLASRRPDASTSDLASSLNNLANRLSELGRREEALEVATESVDHYRYLANQQPDAFMPELAMGLGNLASRLRVLGHKEEALQVAAEAVDHFRDLANLQPGAFILNLAMSLTNLANSLRATGCREVALEAVTEAVGHCRDLANLQPEVYKPSLALTLNNRADVLSELGRWDVALETATEAVSHYRHLANRQPDAFLPDLARCLTIQAKCLGRLGSEAAALEVDREAITILKSTFLRHPLAFAELMSLMSRQYIERCERLGQEPDVDLLAPIAEALQRLQNPAKEPQE